MIISDKHRFVFVHIPKCAGTSVRRALAPYDDYNGWFNNRIDFDPNFGKLDFVHLPLSVMEKVLPDEYKKLCSYDAYALVRHPESRFQSAFSQYVKMYRGTELAQMQDNEIDREVDSVISILKSTKDLTEPKLIHFMRQEDFIKDDFGIHVENIFPVTQVDKLLSALSQRIGVNIPLHSDQNRTLVLKTPFLRGQVLETNRVMKSMLPEAVYDPVRRLARRFLMRPMRSELIAIFKKKSTLEFIEAYYEGDFHLYEKAEQEWG